MVFTSSIAVFGAPFPDAIGDEFFHTPLTSYGTQKAIGELLLADYSRRGFFDGIGIRLPTICVRPGKPNKAASGFFSNILREPLAGQEAVLPVSDDVRHWHASPRSAVGFLLHAATMDTRRVGARRNLTMPGLSATVGEQIAALRRVAGDKVVARIRREPDPIIIGIVAGWPRNFDADARAQARLHHGREDFRRHHPHPHRGRTRRQVRRLNVCKHRRMRCGHDPGCLHRRMHDRAEAGRGAACFRAAMAATPSTRRSIWPVSALGSTTSPRWATIP